MDCADLGVDPGHVGHREAEPGGDGGEDLLVADEPALHHRLPQRRRRGRLLLPKGGERLLRQQRFEGVHQPFVGELHAVARRRGGSGAFGKIDGQGDGSEGR